MKSSLFKSLCTLGTALLACSCSDKPSSSDHGELNFTPCEDVRYLPAEGLVIFNDHKVTDINGVQVGTITQVPNTTVVIVKDMYGNTVINQLDVSDPTKVKIIAGDPSQCAAISVPTTITSCIDAWLYTNATKNYLIYADLTVTDEAWNQIGILNASATSTIASISDMAGTRVTEDFDFSKLTSIKGDNIRYKILEPAYHLKDATGDYLIYQNTVVTNADGVPVGYADFATGTIKSVIDNVTPLTVANIATLPIILPTSKCADYSAPVASSSSTLPVLSSSSIYVPPVQSSSSQPQIQSSSSSAKSSSSSAKSSSSSAKSSSSVATGGCPTIKTKGGGGSGFASRYWDCCKPHCSWPEHSGGNYSKQCTNKGKSANTNWGDGSICSGGPQMTCTSQIPFTIDGCEEYGFAFAAVPASNGGQCGKCFQLTFTGEGHYSSTNANTRKLKTKNKKLIIMATNVGGDVQQGQFDIMIPGGGVGMFNGCSSMGWGSQGEQYGGLLSECEKENNYKAAKYASCLTEKCNKSFANDEEAKKGCLFLATWMEAAGNPEHNYVEGECPAVLKSRY